jgi:hypothetical protein
MATALLLLLTPPAAQAADFAVTSTADTGGTCSPFPATCASLRQAIASANANGAASDTISINLLAGEAIAVTSQLPPITSPTAIFGHQVELDGVGAPANVDGLQLSSGASNSIVEGLFIDRFTRDGIKVNGANFASIRDCTIGTDSAGDTGRGNGGNGITIIGTTGVKIGVTAVGSPSLQGNSILANAGDGINADSTSASATIVSNSIGFVSSGPGGNQPNGGDGIDLSGPSNVVGEIGLGNVIVGSGEWGVRLTGASANANQIQANSIGLNQSGASAGNGEGGVRISTASSNIVGGTEPGSGNTISGNEGDGVFVSAGATDNDVVGNRIGTNAAGNSLRPNSDQGVHVDNASGNLVGGSAPGSGNVISGNLGTGVDVENGASANNVVQGNRIGTNLAGTLALPNARGISAAGSTLVGGAGPGEGNLVSGNITEGIRSEGSGGRVEGNQVGTNAAGTGPIPNGTDGIDVQQSNVTVGGSGAAANTVAFNLGPGIHVEQAGDVIAENSVFSNGGLGIDADPVGVTANGPESLPSLSVAAASAGQTVVSGTIASAPNRALTLRFFASPACDPSGFGEGETPLGAAAVTTGGAGNAGFQVTLPVATAPGQQVTATATGPGGTSEFSACRTVEIGRPGAVPPSVPQLTSLTQSVSRWRAGNALASVSKRQLPVGTTFKFKLDRAATALFTFTQSRTGRKVGTISLPAHAGTNKVRFQGRLSRSKKLKPGRYTLTLTATSSGLRSASRSLSFTIVRG